MVFNSEFDPDNDGWYKVPAVGQPVSAPIKTPITTAYSDLEETHGSRGISFKTTDTNMLTSKPVRVASNNTYSISMLAGRPESSTVVETTDFRLGLWDNNKNYIGAIATSNPLDGTEYVPLTYYKTEDIAIPEGTYYVSFVLAKSSWSASDVIYQPMLNYGATASKYVPTYATNSSGSILTLLKDNWSIGIADNAGAITSGIVGNSSNMSLISNNVVINAPSTQIKGTAWINSAMIGTGQIGNAQIGDLAVTSAKISNLDVNKITGNVSSFIQSNWNGVFASTTIDNTGMSINGGNTTTKFDTSGAHFTRGNLIADYSYGTWRDDSNANTSSVGMYLGVRGNTNSFTNIIGPNGGSVMLIAGENMDYGSNNNIVKGYMNIFSGVNIRSRLDFKGSRWNSPTFIEADENRRTLNFYTALGNTGNDGNYFWFSQNVLSNGVFSSASQLSKKNVKSAYEEDALGEIAKTQLVSFEYKNRLGQTHVSPIIDDVNSEKEYYIPKTILGQDNEYVDMYSMISMAWKALQQVNDRLEKLESRNI